MPRTHEKQRQELRGNGWPVKPAWTKVGVKKARRMLSLARPLNLECGSECLEETPRQLNGAALLRRFAAVPFTSAPDTYAPVASNGWTNAAPGQPVRAVQVGKDAARVDVSRGRHPNRRLMIV